MASMCPNCGGSLLFSPSKNAMTCRKCGSSFAPEEVDAESKKLLEDKEALTMSELFGTKEKASYECRIYTCNHCGGNIIINDTEASTVCIYCGNPAVVFKRVSKEMRPDGIIPFSVTKDEAKMLIKTHLKRGFFIPSELKRSNFDEVRGIYIPYWIVNCDFNDAVAVEGEVKEEKNTRKTYFGKAGTCTFRNVSVDASLRLNDNISKKLEPFVYEEAKDFDEDYLSGFYSDSSDLSVSDLRAAVLKRCDEMFGEEMMRLLPYVTHKVVGSSPSVDIHDDAVYLMIPTWFYTVTYKDKPLTILVNGQTGKTVGAVPFDKRKVIGLGVSIFVLLSLLLIVPFLCFPFYYQWEAAYRLVPIFFVAGMSLAGVSVKMLKRVLNNINDTQSGSTFMYVKNRQE